jgi:hypothetical protein
VPKFGQVLGCGGVPDGVHSLHTQIVMAHFRRAIFNATSRWPA